MTIIHLRGTSGSGKSSVVRAVMKRYYQQDPLQQIERKRPTGYLLQRDPENDGPDLIVIGHYETPCGGCDTIPSLDLIYEYVREAAHRGCDVLFEGLLISPELTRTIALHHEFPDQVHIIGLDVPLEDCLDGIMSRRHARAKDGADVKDVNPKNTTAKWKQTKSACARLTTEGLQVQMLGRDAALARCLELLKLA